MGIKETLAYHEKRYEYEGQDGDSYDIKIVQSDERKYIQFCRKDQEGSAPVTIDGQMLADMYFAYQQFSPSSFGSSSNQTLSFKPPKIIDHRNAQKAVSNDVDKAWDLSTIDQSEIPESAFEPIGETPEEWSLKPQENLPQWKKEALLRKEVEKPQYSRHGNSGINFKRIGANEFI